MMQDNTTEAFFALVKAGLWELDVQLASFGKIDFNEVYRLAEEQAVVGLVAAGLEHVKDIKVPQDIALTFVGSALQLERRNTDMNIFIGHLIERMRRCDIYALLVKGQGVAQCYERPLWRTSGDVDLFLSKGNFEKALKLLTPISSRVQEEKGERKHVALTIDGWEVELHGTLWSCLWNKIDHTIDEVQYEVFCGGAVRSWMNGDIQVFLPRADEDIVFVFSHILQHFYRGGIGLRQICDWCRLLWAFRDTIKSNVLEQRLKKMGVFSEWKTISSFAVVYLGMPESAIPLYSPDTKWRKKAERLSQLLLEMGNFGHSRDLSYQQGKNTLVRKSITAMRLAKDNLRQLAISPVNPIRVWFNMFFTSIKK